MTRPRVFFAAVLVALATALAVGFASRPPAGRGSALVWLILVASGYSTAPRRRMLFRNRRRTMD
jgi:hypothetical protein